MTAEPARSPAHDDGADDYLDAPAVWPGHAPYRREYVRVERVPPTPGTGKGATFTVTGELDLGSLDLLMGAVEPVAVPDAHLVLDLSRLDFMDCSAVRALIQLLRAVGPDGSLIIRRPSPPVRKVLDLVGAERFERLVITDS